MKTFLLFSLAAGLVLPLHAATQQPATVPGGSAMAFSGFGADTPGGRGGRVIKVTTLAHEGDGSFKAALAAEGRRIIVFEVGGVIDWQGDEVTLENGDVTIAGETAPSPGITIVRGSLTVSTHDVIVRHLHVRVGDGGDLKKAGWQPDSMTTQGPKVKNVLYDHCSSSWSIDENLSVSGPRVKNGTSSFVTIRNCIIAEALNNSTHPKGPHSKGTLIHDFTHDVAIVGNLYAHDYNRNPYLKPNTTVFMANNVIYDPGNGAIHFAWVPDEYKVISDPMLPSQMTAIANLYRMGASTHAGLKMFTCSKDAVMGTAKLYQRDSRVYGKDGELLWDGAVATERSQIVPEVTVVDQPMLEPKGFTPLPVALTEAFVLKNAGARPKDRDRVDQRIVNDYLARKGRVIDSQDEVGGYPDYAPTRRKLVVPETSAEVDAWLAAYRQEVEY
ncbi:hypothetical protein K0B96_14820 [Horticoccus luteus]|uniref:Pectate lyase n=1 Tax=Horticoccus luteus TaxID=2862869 RepID=A0A8F9TT32_9BACT|nr:hypothetical protein [Horticoccus luteus]QYM78556.1 hypothetical protein K0B96_14820 [Horticoccus luteus]